jgi:hypothetical protein
VITDAGDGQSHGGGEVNGSDLILVRSGLDKVRSGTEQIRDGLDEIRRAGAGAPLTDYQFIDLGCTMSHQITNVIWQFYERLRVKHGRRPADTK